MYSFPRPDELHLSVVREPAEGTCPECGSTDLASYKVVSEGGWWAVRKCQSCLYSLEREPAPALGSLVPLGLTVGNAQPAGRS